MNRDNILVELFLGLPGLAPRKGLGKLLVLLSIGYASEFFTVAAEVHWAYRPLIKPPVPEAGARFPIAQNPVDAFIFAKLEGNGLQPAPEAGKRTLLRRVYFDLIGLPPAPEEMRAFLANTAPDAYERVVDQLLASPRYG